MGLFLTAGLGSGSTFQMIAIIFRQITLDRVKKQGGTDEQAQHEAVTETAAALGFISAIGAVGGFFIQSLWHLAGDDRIAGRRHESVPRVLHRLRARHLAGVWPQILTNNNNYSVRSRRNVMSKLLDRFRYFKTKGQLRQRARAGV
jgi:hypothetical protein